MAHISQATLRHGFVFLFGVEWIQHFHFLKQKDQNFYPSHRWDWLTLKGRSCQMENIQPSIGTGTTKLPEFNSSLFDFHSISHFPQVSEAVGDGVEWLRRSDLRFVRLPLGRPGVPATSSARWKVNWGAKKLVSPAPFRKMPKLCAFEILKLLLTTTAAFRYPTLISESHGDRLGEKELHLYWRDFHMGLGAGRSIFRS